MTPIAIKEALRTLNVYSEDVQTVREIKDAIDRIPSTSTKLDLYETLIERLLDQ